ncbi:MAG: hypothetical protein A3G33_00040 [Omnitrophica bacterium RIFCSPLOWO2_12_FULL_44_17]|uniref:PilZ domain-containing protein n=1 Tax=Candidatus Danuiimicrobium aquiferis TaxID=1801832 RepID=A0A1G1KST3_9BACT|nr:MAG: hypothetical protein A3B72_10150 [Omnitrophica bacterium RIFCSPHIGHO2_02_FULL_45_28]OGW88275.1 MAG: hypothetical protein A3E74_10465 [Omnitrophica bacterium RIFCSPHIGHO2_12_FULL_44_12]OGW95970.1 MAG: hypothetical protein A3G33_00040 [Omnitrophica bacterium RIFCSPLOWO2_12_FULL_44_17]OGX01964.1 MAG: hypothetical protein A3J12_04620 [Omnitrophica bacterium RIFCSPLOWO2_02_FULL_44_11]
MSPWPFFSLKKKIVKKNARKYQRARIPLLIRYHLKGIAEEKVSNLRDLAAGGIRFTTDSEIEENTRIKVDIRLPWRDEPFESIAKVVRCVRLKSGPYYRVATQFVGLKKEEIVELESFVDAIVNYQRRLKKAK